MHDNTESVASDLKRKRELRKKLKSVLDHELANPPSREEIQATIRRFEERQKKLWGDNDNWS